MNFQSDFLAELFDLDLALPSEVSSTLTAFEVVKFV